MARADDRPPPPDLTSRIDPKPTDGCGFRKLILRAARSESASRRDFAGPAGGGSIDRLRFAEQMIANRLRRWTADDRGGARPIEASDRKFEEAKLRVDVVVVRDAGLTEVPRGTETVLAYIESEE